MKITFAGQVIALGPDFGGFDAVQGFEPEGKCAHQLAGWMEAGYDTIFPRGNRLNTLSGTVELGPQAGLEEALLLREGFYGTLPNQGDLVKFVGASAVTYPAAFLQSVKPSKNAKGVAVGFQFTFLAGKPSTFDGTGTSTDAPITDPGGAPLTDPSGVPITDP